MRFTTLLFLASVLALQVVPVQAKTPEPNPDVQTVKPLETRSISLEEAIRKALLGSPRLKAGQENVGAVRGERLQSSLLPNPQLSAEAENIFGSDDAKGLDEAEVTVGGEQLIELGGKRAARIGAADNQLAIADLQYAATALDLIQDITDAWTEAVAASEELKLAKRQHEIASDVLNSVSKRVSAAAEPAIQKSKSQVALASSRIAQKKAERSLDIALKTFAGLWGEAGAHYELETAAFFQIERPDVDVEPSVDANPDVQLLAAQVNAAKAVLGIERANAIPDVSVGLGVRRSRESDTQSLVAGLSIPIPVYNRNQGSIIRAGHRASMAEQDQSSGLQAINIDLARVLNAIETAWLELETLNDDVIPIAEKAFSQANDGYRAGKFPYLDVLDAQRTLSEVRAQRIATLREFHHAKAELDRLTGKNMNYMTANGEGNDIAQ